MIFFMMILPLEEQLSFTPVFHPMLLFHSQIFEVNQAL